MRKIFLAAAMLSTLAFNACDPNKDIYNKLDAYNDAHPYHDSLSYTLIDADYDSTLLGNPTVEKYMAFNDTLPAALFVPTILAKRFPAYNLSSSALVTYNYMSLHPAYLDVLFGYQLTTADYNSFGDATISANQSFTSSKPSTSFIPGFLLTKYPTKVSGDTVNILLKYNFTDNLERYAFDGSVWTRASFTSDDKQFGIVLVAADYISMGGDVAKYLNFSSTVLSENYLPSFLKNKYPYAQPGATRIVKFTYHASSGNSDKIEQYTYDGSNWTKTPSIITRTDPYRYKYDLAGNLCWKFDPTVTYTTTGADLQLLVNYVYKNLSRTYGSSYGNDEFYYGASAYYNNFDLRLSNKSTYNIPGFETGTDEEKVALTWSRLQEGLEILLRLKFTKAVPEVYGVKVYYWVTFKTYENDLSKKTYVGIFTVDNSTGSPVFTRDTAEEKAQVDAGALTADQVNWNR